MKSGVHIHQNESAIVFNKLNQIKKRIEKNNFNSNFNPQMLDHFTVKLHLLLLY